MMPDAVGGRNLTEVVVNSILVVEDDAEAVAFMKTLLESRGYSVLVAKDGGQAQSAFVMRKPDFVIMDLIFQGESGFEICERFKQSEKAVPVLIVSAIELEESRELATRVGADGYLTKPYDPEELLSKILEVADEVWWQAHAVQPQEERRIRFTCTCGKRFRVSPQHRGKMLTCPECGEPAVVPMHD